MNEYDSWSANVGRWMGVRVSVHVLLILFVASIFGLQYQHDGGTGENLTGTALVTAMVLLGSLILHEVAHVFALVNLGGFPRRIVLTPWGGNSDFHMPTEPVARLIVFVAGPFVNAAVFLISAVLLIQANHADLFSLINPFNPHAYSISNNAIPLIKIVAWINFQLLMVNLIPCFPFDGAQICRTLLEMFGLAESKLRSESALMVLGNGCALTIIGFSWLIFGQHLGPVEPAWFLILVVGIALYFAARYSFDCEAYQLLDEPGSPNSAKHDWDFEGYPPETSFFGLADAGDLQGLPSDEDLREEASASQWMREKQHERASEQLERESEEEQKADEILDKLHSGGGISSLSEHERAILNRVSQRLRKRRSNASIQSE